MKRMYELFVVNNQFTLNELKDLIMGNNTELQSAEEIAINE